MSAPILDMRRADDVQRELDVRRAGFVPTFAAPAGGPGAALERIAAEQLAALIERLDQAPDKRGLALLDLVGVDLVPAQPARAPVVFEPTPGVVSAPAPAGTRLGATVAGRSDPLVFETETSVTVCGSRLVEVASVDPGRDAHAAHAADLAAGETVTLFSGLTPFAHELYLGHATVFAFSGRATVEIDLALRRGSSEPLRLAAAWWDGVAWREFAAIADPAGDEDSLDGTAGLRRGGVIRLVTPCAVSKPLVIRGLPSHWVRLAVRTPLGPRLPMALPEVERIAVRSIVERRPVVHTLTPAPGLGVPARARVYDPDGTPVGAQKLVVRDLVSGATTPATTANDGGVTLPAGAGATVRIALGDGSAAAEFGPPITLPSTPQQIDLAIQRGLRPDKGVSDGKTIDLTKSFQPLGPSPSPGAALYLACDDVFAKPGAEVTLALTRPRTVMDEADGQGKTYEIEVNAARDLITAMVKTLNDVAAALDAIHDPTTGPLRALPDLVKAGESTDHWYGALKSALGTAINTMKDVVTDDLQNLIDVAFNLVAGILGLDDGSKKEAEKRALQATVSLAQALQELGANTPTLAGTLVTANAAILADRNPDIHVALVLLRGEIKAIAQDGASFLGALPSYLAMKPEDFVAEVTTRIAAAVNAINKAAVDLRALLAQLKAFDPAALVAVSGGVLPNLSGPRVEWEYWDGGRWASLQPSSAGPEAGNLLASGKVRFTVPDHWVASEVSGDTRRWLRARHASGNFARLRLVAWTDAQSNVVNFLPVIEPRPPLLDTIELFYRCASPTGPPNQVLSFDDASWRDHTASLSWPGPPFAPFAACRDDAPTLYLGFDAPIPSGRIGLFVGVEERADATPATLRWEAFDGARFRAVAVRDATRGLTTSGVLSLVWPGDEGDPGSLVINATGDTILLAEAGAGRRYARGADLWLSDDRGGELVEVAATADVDVTLARPVSRNYGGAILRAAPPARFGTPRTWLRARFDPDATPPPVPLVALRANAVMASNVETVNDEILGGSDGSPRQPFFSRRAPLLADEMVEVRELSGARAAVDAPILRDELASQGRASDLRTVSDPATGRVNEAWVRWRTRPTLAFSDGDARDCVVDRVRGRIVFGDGRFGRIPPAGRDNVRASYRAAGDAAGNVPAGAITGVLSGVLARGVTNPLPAQGGAAGETLERLAQRGPAVLRHRRQALTAADYEAIAYEASAAVARARALGAVDERGRTVPGLVRVVIVPVGEEPAPTPTPELRREVHDLIAARMPATIGDGLTVAGPRYADVGVDVTVRPVAGADAAALREAVLERALAFLHPVMGGPGEAGFAFGARLAASDLARALRALPGLDAIAELAFVVDGTPAGEIVELGADRLPAAGAVRISLTELA